MLQAQGLAQPAVKPASKKTVVETVRRLRFLQIDTINIVARAPYFSLFSRIGDYDLHWLDESLADRSLFEYWAHAACFLPIEDYPYHRRMMLENFRHPNYQKWYEKNRKDCDDLLEHVRGNGPVRSADFERKDGKKGTWWDWKFEKDALEFWFYSGELMITRREKFQRVYDLRERVLPDWTDADVPTLEEVIHFLVLQTVQSLGISKREWVADYFRLPKTAVETALNELLANGDLKEVTVEDWAEAAIIPSGRMITPREPTLTTLLTPFDSLICDRKRTKELFGFDFTIECYLPPAKRKYGYYLLPILHRGRLVGRIDAKAHRKEGKFEVIGLFWEPDATIDEQVRIEVKYAIQRCANWHGTPEVLYRGKSL